MKNKYGLALLKKELEIRENILLMSGIVFENEEASEVYKQNIKDLKLAIEQAEHKNYRSEIEKEIERIEEEISSCERDRIHAIEQCSIEGISEYSAMKEVYIEIRDNLVKIIGE